LGLIRNAEKTLAGDDTVERKVWRTICCHVLLATAIYVGTLAWIMVGEFQYAPWTPPRGLFMTSFILMSCATAGVLTEGRASPHRLHRHAGLLSLGAAVL
jgi:hypothetical protein